MIKLNGMYALHIKSTSVRLDSKLGQIGPNWGQIWDFLRSLSVLSSRRVFFSIEEGQEVIENDFLLIIYAMALRE